MNILHYTIGLPPERSGGLTKYATDLMSAQACHGDEVCLLYPQNNIISAFRRKLLVRKNNYKNLTIFVLTKASPVPLLLGVKNPRDIIEEEKIETKLLVNFFNIVKPDIFHIHTLMGLPLELVAFLKSKGVKIVYTTHDYYGLCLKVNFVNQSGELCDRPNGQNCAVCNFFSPASLFLKIRNSKMVLKNKKIFSLFERKKLIKKPGGKNSNLFLPPSLIDEYNNLLIYFQKFYSYVDLFHFNSTVTKNVFERFCNIKKSIVIPISHNGIGDMRVNKALRDCVHFGFIGSINEYKGYPLLISALSEIKRKGFKNWKLHVWGNDNINTDDENIVCEGKYNSSQFDKVFLSMDLLIVPSIWKETFSLVSLEAISYGVPVLLTSNVGAKDIIAKYNSSFVIEPTKNSFYEKLLKILTDPNVLSDYNQKILSQSFDHDFDGHIQEIRQQLYS